MTAVIVAQGVTFVAGGAVFAFAGEWRLALAQVCYAVATAALFLR